MNGMMHKNLPNQIHERTLFQIGSWQQYIYPPTPTDINELPHSITLINRMEQNTSKMVQT